MNKQYLLVDYANLFHRARHTSPGNTPIEDKLGLSLYIILASVNQLIKKFTVDHVVFALDGRSWRKDVYTPYKKTRAEKLLTRSEREIEEDALYFEILNDLTQYLREWTNCSVIKHPKSEADDIIARWIFLHPDDRHIIVSSDTDFYQLITEQVTQYNGISRQYITLDGVYDEKFQAIMDKKTRAPKTIGDPEWLLFEKCIRGDKQSDNIFSACPGARTKSTKNKIGLLDVFADRHIKGYHWNNFMLQRWVDHENVEHKVLDDYERNVKLIDLTKQPIEIIQGIEDTIIDTIGAKEPIPANQLSFQFMKFCGRHDLTLPADTINWINMKYPDSIENIIRHRHEST